MSKLRIRLKRTFFISIGFFCGMLAFSSSAPASKIETPFIPGETLVYEIRWSGIPVGEGVLSVLPLQKIKDTDAFHFELKVKSNSFLDSFYKVRDKITAYTATDLSRSYYYKKRQNEGRTTRDVVVEFDWETGRAEYANFGQPKPPVDILPGTLDPLSTIYFARLQDFESLDEIRVPVTDGKKSIIGKARIVKRENIIVGGNDFDTYILEPEIEEISGVFEKSRDAKIRVWLTADHRKVPVKIESKVAVGSFTAELISIVHDRH